MLLSTAGFELMARRLRTPQATPIHQWRYSESSARPGRAAPRGAGPAAPRSPAARPARPAPGGRGGRAGERRPQLQDTINYANGAGSGCTFFPLYSSPFFWLVGAEGAALAGIT